MTSEMLAARVVFPTCRPRSLKAVACLLLVLEGSTLSWTSQGVYGEGAIAYCSLKALVDASLTQGWHKGPMTRGGHIHVARLQISGHCALPSARKSP